MTLTRLLSDLVAIPSVNPMGRPLAGPEFLETRLTDYLEAWFRELGVRCRAAAGRARPRQPAGVVRRPGVAPADPLRRPSGYGAGRRHDDPAVRARDRRRPAVRPRLVRRQGLRWRRCSSAFARLVRERPAGLGVGAPGLHGRRRVHPHRLVAAGRDEPRGRAGDRRRADAARPGPLPQGRPAVEDPDAGASPATARRPHLGVNAIYRMGRVLDVLEKYAGTLAASTPDPILGPPSCRSAGSRGGRASTSSPTGARSRSTAA